MPDIQIEGGEVLANLDERTITGLLLPYGEEGRTNVGRFTVMAGDITIPADPAVVSLNVDHDRFQPIGRATKLWEQTEGIMATFAIGRTAAGDQALQDAASGTRRCLSAEFKTGIKNGRATGGILAAAAQVVRGAFPSAQVLAADAELDADDAPAPAAQVVSESATVDVYTDEEGRTYRRVYESRTTEETIEPETEADAEAETEQETEVSATAVPATQRAGAPLAHAKQRTADLQTVFAAIADVKNHHPGQAEPTDALAVLAALSDIKMTGAGALPTGGSVIRENWVGQLYQGIGYERQFITLGTLGTNITAGGKKGYTLERGTAGSPVEHFDGTWAGNKTAIPSGVGFTASKASELFRFAFGVDIAREFFDLPGGAEVVEAFLRLVAEDHLVWSDEIARQTWVTMAGAPVAPKTYPGVDGHDYAGAIGQVIQGILAVKGKKADGRRDQPSFVIANEAAYEQLIYTPKDLIPEFVNFTASTDESGTADGLKLVVGDIGIENTPAVIVGSSKAVEFDELAGGPLHIDALDLARGGVDKAIHGYLQRFIIRPEAVVLVGTADAAG